MSSFQSPAITLSEDKCSLIPPTRNLLIVQITLTMRNGPKELNCSFSDKIFMNSFITITMIPLLVSIFSMPRK